MLMLLLFCMVACCSGRGKDEGTTSQMASFDLNWGAPTTDEGGGTLTGLAGYNVYYGGSTRTGDDPKICGMCGYKAKLDVGNVNTYRINLPEDTYYFSITAYDPNGNESAFADEIKAN